MILTWYKTSEPGYRLRVFCLRHLILGHSGPTLADLLVRDGKGTVQFVRILANALQAFYAFCQYCPS